MLTPRQELARKWACDLRRIGKNPLPSRMDKKQPWLDRYAHLWDELAPAELFTPEGWPPTTNFQCVLGRTWRLLVIDLDGPAAVAEWREMCRCRPAIKTWISHSGGGGQHWWFTLPKDYPKPLPKAFLWKGQGEHEAIERLCDKSLVMCPPSIHPATGNDYEWLTRANSPLGYGLGIPQMIPKWVLDLKPLDLRPQKPPEPRRRLQPTSVDTGGLLDRESLLGLVGDKIAMARSWGVRFTGRHRNGWHECAAVGREDSHPSAAVHEESGVYVDKGTDTRLSFFDLAVACGEVRDFKEAATLIRTGG